MTTTTQSQTSKCGKIRGNEARVRRHEISCSTCARHYAGLTP